MCGSHPINSTRIWFPKAVLILSILFKKLSGKCTAFDWLIVLFGEYYFINLLGRLWVHKILCTHNKNPGANLYHHSGIESAFFGQAMNINCPNLNLLLLVTKVGEIAQEEQIRGGTKMGQRSLLIDNQ
jgi:hypothetical protein